MNWVLCGMMGCGKSTVGARLAQKVNRVFVDTDALIVKRYGKISDIFERYGEVYFRDLETELVKELYQKEGQVLSLGGGLVLREENVRLLKEQGKIIFLRAEKQTLVERLRADKDRPLLQNAQSLSSRVDELLISRAPIYERVSDMTVDVDGKSPEQIVDEIIKSIGQV